MEKKNINEQGLYKLKDLKDYEIAKGDPDVRGWDVYSSDKKIIGTVDELIVDQVKMKVRYLNIHLNKDVEKGRNDRLILIPVGAAELDEKKEAVYITNIETVTLLKMPEYGGGAISRDYETNLRKSIKPDEIISRDTDFYNNDLYNEDKFYKSRRRKLYRLRDLDDYGILGDKPDVRGWKVVTANGETIGTVDDLLLDSENKIRYLDIRRNTGAVLSESTYLIVPVGLASLGMDDNKILINMNSESFKNYPAYNGKVITPDYESSIYNAVSKEDERIRMEKENFYSHKNYNDEGFFRRS